RGISQAVMLEEGIEAAELAVMGEMNARDVVRDSVPLLRCLKHFLRRHVVKFRARVDEAGDQPGARDPIDLRTLARDPARRAAPRLGVQRAFHRLPSLNATFQVACRDAGLAQCRSGVLAYLVPAHAVD